jgi:hypothetical protein
MVSIGGHDFAALVPVDFPDESWALADALNIESGYADFIHSWLTGQGLTLRSYWRDAAPVSPASWPTYRRKVYAILNEHLWSARCYQADIPIIPVRSAEILAEFAPGSTRLTRLLADLRANPRRSHDFVQSCRGRASISRLLAADALADRRAYRLTSRNEVHAP